ncbi:MAG TPA: GatB/YqeY domain-containing protein [Chloroflexi bacterium]|nr:GatB/YqeY domain-containing protein [Chloroflexota bacterium]
MKIKEKLAIALKNAMVNKDTIAKNTIRMILANIKNAEIESQKELAYPEIVNILHKEIKIRKDTIQDATTANRDDLIALAEAELSVVQIFLPEAMTAEQLRELTADTIRETHAESIKDMGKVMQALIPRLEGRISNAEASAVVKELLS